MLDVSAAEDFKIGQLVEDKGVYIGRYDTPVYAYSGDTAHSFNLFTTPTDLKDSSKRKLWRSLKGAEYEVNKIEGLFGHDGECYLGDEKLLTALKEDTYQGGWMLPTSDMWEKTFIQPFTKDGWQERLLGHHIKDMTVHTV